MMAQSQNPSRFPVKYLFFTSLPIALGLLLLTLAALNPGIANDALPLLFQDPSSSFSQATGSTYIFLGFFSNFGVMLWFTAGIAMIFSALIRRRFSAPEPRLTQFLIALSIISVALGLDDLLLFHERLAQAIFSVNERLVVIVYGVVILSVGFLYRRELRRNWSWLLLIAAPCLAASIAIDAGGRRVTDIFGVIQTVFLEEGLKFIGLSAFWAYALFLSWRSLAWIGSDHAANTSA